MTPALWFECIVVMGAGLGIALIVAVLFVLALMIVRGPRYVWSILRDTVGAGPG